MQKEQRWLSLTLSADVPQVNVAQVCPKHLQHDITPDHLYTVFAGQDKEATAKAREFFAPYPPSSPSIALMKDGELVHFIERHQVEDRSAEDIAADLKSAFDRYLPLIRSNRTPRPSDHRCRGVSFWIDKVIEPFGTFQAGHQISFI